MTGPVLSLPFSAFQWLSLLCPVCIQDKTISGIIYIHWVVGIGPKWPLVHNKAFLDFDFFRQVKAPLRTALALARFCFFVAVKHG